MTGPEPRDDEDHGNALDEHAGPEAVALRALLDAIDRDEVTATPIERAYLAGALDTLHSCTQ